MDTIFLVGVLSGGIRLAMPMLFAALGETVTERAGVLNVGIEGVMLVGAFLAAFGAVATGSPWGGLLCAIIGGTALALLHAWFCIALRVDQIVTGVALVVLGTGLSGFGFRMTLGAKMPAPPVPSFSRIDFGELSRIDIIGPVLFSHHFLAYVGFAAAFAQWWFLYRTTWGLEIRAIGESPQAADSVGIGVNRVRYAATAFGGAMAGIGGAYLAIAELSGFVENMVAGRGFIAIACVVFGRWNPLGVMLACLFFGLTDAAQVRLQSLNPDIPYQFFVMAPYALAVLFLIFFAGRAGLPRALGLPFRSGHG